MAPASPNAADAGDAPRRDTSKSPNELDSPQRVITRDSLPERTRPYTGSSSPVRRSIPPTVGKQQQLPSSNRFAPLAPEDQGAENPLADAVILIAEAQDQLNIRANILRAYSQAIAKCAEQFSSGYGKRFAQHLRSTLLQHWTAAYGGEASPTPDRTITEQAPHATPRQSSVFCRRSTGRT
ncbi:hypothetical protein LEL_10857 [Akanthomyces lecanii RCEF 1005]|uniref:Uncharacterized protein n=1 Tax=Akanthomyces lecanii RCEF 1005 TaxID=1081108 RepID=A0A167S4V2_CORDF|nr:hypothetical protein LEL_10857 [Akanthomyces lecanii RCEF 1005]